MIIENWVFRKSTQVFVAIPINDSYYRVRVSFNLPAAHRFCLFVVDTNGIVLNIN